MLSLIKMVNRKIIILLLFLSMFITSLIFINQPGIFGDMNPSSRIFLTISLVDYNSLNIDNFYNQTSDRSFFNGHYYSDKEPGLSFIATPIYLLIKQIIPILYTENNHSISEPYIFSLTEEKIVIHLNMSKLIILSKFILPIFTSTIFTLLTSFIIFKFAIYETKNFKKALFFSSIYYFSSLAFHYSLVFLNHAFSTFLMAVSFYLFYLYLKKKTETYIYLATLISSFSVLVDAMSAIFLPLIYIFMIFRKNKNIIKLLLISFLGILPMFLFNYVNFNNPFTLPRVYLDPAVWKPLPGLNGIILDPFFILNSAWRLLIDPYRGIFFYYPLLIFSIPILFVNHRGKILSFFSISFFILNLVATSSWWAWWHGGNFGPRFLLLSFPFLFFLLIKSSERFKIIYKFLIFLAPLGLFINLIGLVGAYEDIIKDIENNSLMKIEFKERFEKLQLLPNVLKDYYLKKFLEEGPYSYVLEFVKIISNSKNQLRPDNVVIYSGFYPRNNESFWLMGNNASIIFYSNNSKNARFYFKIDSILKERDIKIYFNGNLYNIFRIRWGGKLYYTPLLDIKMGINNITFESDEKCVFIDENRCASFILRNIFLAN
jgi:hypothetical protein